MDTEAAQKVNPEKKILQPLLSGLEPETFWSRVWRSATELSLFCMFFAHNENHMCQK